MSTQRSFIYITKVYVSAKLSPVPDRAPFSKRSLMNRDKPPFSMAFKTLFHKGPVNHPGAQASALAARRIIEPHLTEQERVALATAHAHATLTREGRREWDKVCKAIETRFEKEGIL